MKEAEIRKMHLEDVVVEEGVYAVGDKVNVDSGPLEGFEGVITEINVASQKVRVNIQMFGRSTDAEVEFSNITKIQD